MKKIVLGIVLVIFCHSSLVADEAISYAAHALTCLATGPSANYSVVGGTIGLVGSAEELFVARYTDTGILDTTFAAQGFTGFLPSPATSARGRAIAVQSSDAQIVVAGTAICENCQDFLIARFTTDGALDTTFATPNGYLLDSFDDSCAANSIKIQSDGKLVVAGYSVQSGIPHGVIVRYLSNGTLDTTFNGTGRKRISVGNFSCIEAVLVQSDDKLVTAGWAGINADSEQIVLTRTLSDGSADTTFGTAGVVTTSCNTWSHAMDLVQQDDGKIVIVGTTEHDKNKKMFAARYNTDGSLDTSFGTDGFFMHAVETECHGSALLLHENHIILIGSMVTGTDSLTSAIAMWLTTQGELDTSVNDMGMNIFYFGTRSRGYDVTLQNDNKLLVAGDTNNNILLSRIHATGVQLGLVDRSYGDEGFTSAPGNNHAGSNVVAYLWDEKSQNIAGGTFTAGSWQNRDLNKLFSFGSFVSLTGTDQFILEPGSFFIDASSPAYLVNNHRIGLFNYSNGFFEKLGTSEVANTTQSHSNVRSFVFVDQPKIFGIKHRCQTTRESDGFGSAANFDFTGPLGAAGNEVYTVVKVTKLS